MAKKKKAKKKRFVRGKWSKSDINLLKKEFPNKSCVKVAEKLGRPLYAAKKKAYRLGLRKSKRYLKSLGRA